MQPHVTLSKHLHISVHIQLLKFQSDDLPVLLGGGIWQRQLDCNNLELPIQVLLVLCAFKRCVECRYRHTFIAV